MHAGKSCCRDVTLLENLQARLLHYESPARREQACYISVARDLAHAQFKLADDELCKRLWQNVAERKLNVDRILNLMYGCFFQTDQQAMREVDQAFMNRQASESCLDQRPSIGIFEHC